MSWNAYPGQGHHQQQQGYAPPPQQQWGAPQQGQGQGYGWVLGAIPQLNQDTTRRLLSSTPRLRRNSTLRLHSIAADTKEEAGTSLRPAPRRLLIMRKRAPGTGRQITRKGSLRSMVMLQVSLVCYVFAMKGFDLLLAGVRLRESNRDRADRPLASTRIAVWWNDR